MDIMIPSLVSKAQVIQWQRHKRLSHSAANNVRFCKNHSGVKYPSPHCRPNG